MPLSKAAAKRWAGLIAPLALTALLFGLAVSFADRLPSRDTAMAVVLGGLQWLWAHLQGGWLVAVLLLLALTQNSRLATQVDELRATVADLQEHQSDHESPYAPDDD